MAGPLRFTPPATSASSEPVTPNKRVLARRQTREKVLRAAREVFTRRDYARATIRAIAHGAGMSTGDVTDAFADKADLWRAAMGTEPPQDSPVVRAAPDMLKALKALMAFRPTAAPACTDPDYVAAWSAAEDALALAEGRAEAAEARAA